MVAAKRILVNLTNVCVNNPDDIAVLNWTIKLYLVSLSVYITESDGHAELSSHITNIQEPFVTWFGKPSTGFEDYFGGKNGKRIKNEIKVCYLCS